MNISKSANRAAKPSETNTRRERYAAPDSFRALARVLKARALGKFAADAYLVVVFFMHEIVSSARRAFN